MHPERTPVRGRSQNGSLIFNRNRKIAAVFTIRVAADSHAAGESESEVARRIEPRKRGKVARDVLETDCAAAERIEFDPARQLDAYRPAWRPVDDSCADHRPRTDVGHGALGRARTVGAEDGRALALAEQDQPVEIQTGLDLKVDIVAICRILARGRRLVTQTALRFRWPRCGSSCGARRNDEGKKLGAAH